MMSYIEDLPNKDISARLGISLSTVENHIYSALKQLRVALAKDKAFLLFTLLPYLATFWTECRTEIKSSNFYEYERIYSFGVIAASCGADGAAGDLRTVHLHRSAR